MSLRIVRVLCFAIIHWVVRPVPYAMAQCPNFCNNRGECNTNGQCICMPGFTGGDCSQRQCPKGTAFSDSAHSTDLAHQNTECSGRGHCDHTTGRCQCAEAFTGVACERLKCHDNCSGRGRCVSLKQYAQQWRSLESKRYSYDLWDAEKVYGCVCDPGYGGSYDCSRRTCPSGDDPMTPGGEQEMQLLRCSAMWGELVLFLEGLPSGKIRVGASKNEVRAVLKNMANVGDVLIDYSEGDELCRGDGKKNIVSITFLDRFGPLPPLVPELYDANPGSFVEISADDPTEKMVDDYGVEFLAVKGSKDNRECSNRGLCDQGTGSCACFHSNGDLYAGSDGYGNSGPRGDCGFPVTSISDCPSSCSNHGFCDADTKTCLCENGFSGGDCSIRSCEYGWSWFSYPSSHDRSHDEWVECSNMGVCHRHSGICECREGFFGSACQYMDCGRGGILPCHGHGQCLSMRSLAEKNTLLNGVASPQIYGSDPNRASTWDADRIFGCHCDKGWDSTYDCSQRSCIQGKDPLGPIGDLEKPCSNHGICDSESGKCSCFSGWGSSDGNGNAGHIDDCGHRLDLVSSRMYLDD